MRYYLAGVVLGILFVLAGRASAADMDPKTRAAIALGQSCNCATTGVCTCGPDCQCDPVLKLESFEYTCKRASKAVASAQQTESYQSAPASPGPVYSSLATPQYQSAPVYYDQSAILGTSGSCANGQCSNGQCGQSSGRGFRIFRR